MDEHSWISGFSSRLHAYSHGDEEPDPSATAEADDGDKKAG
jgi:hypothetical protein